MTKASTQSTASTSTTKTTSIASQKVTPSMANKIKLSSAAAVVVTKDLTNKLIKQTSDLSLYKIAQPLQIRKIQLARHQKL